MAQEGKLTTYESENEDQEALVVGERLDEQQIVEALRGRVIDRLFHEFDVRGQKAVMLSWAGVKYFALQLKHISIDKVELTETEESYRATAWAYDKVRDVRVMGAAEQSKYMKLRDGSRVPDEFALAKVVSKSQRNSLRNLLPETMISEAFKLWKESRGLNPTSSFPSPSLVHT